MLGKFLKKTVLQISGASILALASLFVVFYATPAHADVYFASSTQANASSITLPPHLPGELIFISALRTTNTAITVPSGWTVLQAGSFNNPAGTAYDFYNVTAYMIATSSSHVSGTWTNAQDMIAGVVYSDVPDAPIYMGVSDNDANTSSGNITFGALPTFSNTDGSSLVVTLLTAGKQSSLSGYVVPTGFTLERRYNFNRVQNIGYLAGQSSFAGYASTTVSDNFRSFVFEVYEEPPPPPPPPPPIENLLASSTALFPYVTNFELVDVTNFADSQMYMLFFGILSILMPMMNWFLSLIVVASIFVLIYSAFRWLRILK